MIDVRAICLAIAALGVLSACNGDRELQQQRAMERRDVENEVADESVFDLLRGNSQTNRQTPVNRYLWQASLDILSFLPVESADPFSGVLVTGWGSVRGTGPYRVTVYISDPSLDARALKVAAFRGSPGRAVPVGAAENRALEDAILTRARQLRIAGTG